MNWSAQHFFAEFGVFQAFLDEANQEGLYWIGKREA